MQIVSPVTHSNNVELIIEIPSAQIIQQYETEYKIDVKRFFVNIKNVSIYKCLDSGYRFYYPENIIGDGRLYEDLQKVSDVYYMKWKWEFEIAQKFVKANDALLDIGCGSGNFLISQKNKTSNLFGLEFNDLAIKKCKDNGLNIFKEYIEEHAKSNSEKYDVVTSFQVLEHVFDIKSFIENNLKVLKTGGKLVIGVPHSNPYLYKKDMMHTLNLPPHHMGLWDEKAFQSLPQFFKMKLEGIYIEPLLEFEYWLKLNYNINIKLPALLQYAYVKTFARFFKGRNIVAVYSKI
ncbi:MAG: class I SAM-dependent methyltransferase [Bacteroidota bacterium]